MTGTYQNSDGSIYKVWCVKDTKTKTETWHAQCTHSQTKTSEPFIIDIQKWLYLVDFKLMNPQ